MLFENWCVWTIKTEYQKISFQKFLDRKQQRALAFKLEDQDLAPDPPLLLPLPQAMTPPSGLLLLFLQTSHSRYLLVPSIPIMILGYWCSLTAKQVKATHSSVMRHTKFPGQHSWAPLLKVFPHTHHNLLLCSSHLLVLDFRDYNHIIYYLLFFRNYKILHVEYVS